MVITPKQVKNLTYLVVDDLYEPVELLQIKTELNELLAYAQSAEQTRSANDEKGVPAKTGTGLFLDRHYDDRTKSVILNLNRKLFCKEIVDSGAKLSQYFYTIGACTNDTTLVNFYGANEEYKRHRDFSCLTAVTFFSLGEIEGGDFEFPEVNAVVPFKENRMVIFPGCAEHAAKQTQAKAGNYRVSMSQFLNYRC